MVSPLAGGFITSVQFHWPSGSNRFKRTLPKTPGPGGFVQMSVDQAKTMFYREYVFKRVREAEYKFLSRVGAWIKQDANRSMRHARKGQKPAPIDHPPRSRVGHLKRFNFFLVDYHNVSVMVGPILLPRSRIPVPGVHEHGMTVSRRARKHPKSKNFVQRTYRYPKRPFMKPALDKNTSPRVLATIKDSLRK